MTASARPTLWRHADFMKLWSAATVSLLGSQVSLIAIPYIAAVLLRASAFEVGLLAALEMLPFVLFTLPGGAWLDRMRRRPMLIAGDLGRAAALSTIPIAYALGVLAIGQLYVVAFVAGTLTVFFDVADQAYLPALLSREDLVEGNAKLEISTSAAQIAGPGLGGALVGVVGAPFAVVADAASFVASGALISLIGKPEPKPGRHVTAEGRQTSLREDISEGLRFVLGNRYLRSLAGCIATSNLADNMAFAIFPIFFYRELGMSPALFGIAISLGSFGFLLGATTAALLPRRFGTGPVLVATAVIDGPAVMALAAIPPAVAVALPILVVCWFVIGFAQVVFNVNQLSFRQAICPLEMQGRMNATMRFLIYGTIPIGALAGGVLATVLTTRAAILIGGAIATSSVLWLLVSPVRSLHAIPMLEPGAANEPAHAG